jgi:alkylation response protein AidB-like acyl-CoA dehydrogenase
MYDDRDTLLKAARSLAPEIERRAAEGEALRTLPADISEEIRTAGLFNLFTPRTLGGLEQDPTTVFEVIEELSRADGSTGWTALIGNSSAFLAWLEPDAARELIGADARFAASSVWGPLGRAEDDGTGAYRVSGRWPFNSGCPHARICSVGVFVMDGEAPRMVPDRGPDWRFAFFPRASAEVIDTWRAAGLQGTGSHDVAVTGLRVPAEHIAAPLFEPARHAGPLWLLPFYSLAGIPFSAFALGVGRRALDEFSALAPVKRRAGGPQTVAEDPHTLLTIARAEAGLQAARSFVLDAIGELWETACGGAPPSLQQRTRLQLAVQHAMDSAVAAVDAVFPLCGADAIYSDRPLQRCFRDLHTAKQHIYFSIDSWRRCAAHRFDDRAPTLLI